MPTPISSLQNNRIKNIVKLQNRRQRDTQQLTSVEGAREIGCALKNGFVPTEAFLCPDLIVSDEATAVAAQLAALEANDQCQLFTVSKDVFAKMAYRGEKDGLLMVLTYWSRPLQLSQSPFIVVVEGGEKPGNLGAILRTADAVKVDGVIICTSDKSKGTDIYNPNVIRASLGAIFTVPIVTMKTKEALAWLTEKQINIAAATPDGDHLYTAVNLRKPVAIVMGSEAIGLSQLWLDAADLKLRIPMLGQVDSLNLSVSTAVMLYEVIRQRRNQ